MKKVMFNCLWISLLGLTFFTGTHIVTKDAITKALAITAGTITYHFGMRLIVGLIYNRTFHNRMDYAKKWFQVSKNEMTIYKKLNVKKWKKHIPTYDPDTFDIEKHSISEIIQATCQSELVHETIMVLSFIPILFSIWFGEILVFIITSIVACAFDCIFVILQRYNRPRLLRLVK